MQARAAIPERAEEARTRDSVTVTGEAAMRATRCGFLRTAPGFVRRRDRRGRIVVGRTRLVKELLSPRSDSALRFMLITLPPGGVSEDVLVGRGEKGGYVLSGRVELTVDGRRSELSEGDSFQFESHLPHQLANPTGDEAVVFWIMSVLEGHF